MCIRDSIISDVTSRIVILICEEHIQSSLVDVEVDLLVVRQILMLSLIHIFNTVMRKLMMVFQFTFFILLCFLMINTKWTVSYTHLILRAIEELTFKSITYKSASGKSYDFNTADKMNCLLVN